MKTIILFLLLTLSVGIFAQDQTVNGNLDVTKQIKLGLAGNEDNKSPGITGVWNDDFLFKGRYLNHYGYGFYRRDSDPDLRSYISDYFGIDFFTEGTHRLTITRAGNVGIGTINPQNKLEVNGTIRTKEVKIEATNWADFVFNKDYRLPTLKEVENHIKAKGTLPDIPSEQEVMKNGIDVGEMQAKLLQKVEELTLYVIELKKENEAQDMLIKKLLEERK